MIKINFYEDNQTHQISRIEMSGHAESGPEGHDLVCAAVSAVVLSTFNYLEELELMDEDVQIDADELNGGYLAVQFFLPEPQRVVEFIDYLFFSLNQIADAYPQFIQIRK